MTHELLHHAVTALLQATPHAIGSTPPPVQPSLGGCVDSPEAATNILMAVGAAGLFYGTTLARKFTRRTATKSLAL